jgi:energy-coupling factor transporter ATP-binding protein EcfA2
MSTTRPIYVLDEWAADQDPEFRRYSYEELLPEFKRRGKTVFVVSYDDRYYHCADRIITMEYGKIRSEESRGREAARVSLLPTSSSEYRVEAISLAQLGKLPLRATAVPFIAPSAIISCYENRWCDSEPLILRVSSLTGAWIFPLRIERGPDDSLLLRFYGHGLVDLMDCVRVGEDPLSGHAVQALMGFLGRTYPHAFLDLVGLSPDSEAGPVVEAWARTAAGRLFMASDKDRCPIAAPPLDQATMAAGRTLRKCLARARRAEFVLVEPESPAEILRSVNSLLSHHSQKWRATFDALEFAALHTLVRTWSGQPWTRLPTLMARDGRIAAVLFILVGGTRRYLYIQSYNPVFTALSPSRCAIAFYLKSMTSRKATVLDFLRGEEDYKSEFCSQSYALRRITVACDPTLDQANLATVHDSFV